MPASRAMADLVTQAEYARSRKARGLAGGTQKAVCVAVQQGVIPVFGPEKRIDPALADQKWAENRRARPATGEKAPETAKNGHDSAPEAQQAPPAAQIVLPDTGYAAARARREHAEAEQAELELKRKKGELVARADIERGVFEVAREMRDTMEAAINQLAPELAPLTTAEECERVLRRHNRAVFDVLVRKWREKVGPLPDGGIA